MLPQENQRYTYREYLNWPQEERWEILEGCPYMQASPTWQHQSISRELLTQFGQFLRNKTCQVFAAPFDVRFPEKNQLDEETTTVLQPDLVVVCDKSGLKGTGYSGTPSLVIEISSPSTARMDRVFKFNLYERAGVKEYWIVDPDTKIVSVFLLQPSGRFGRIENYLEQDRIDVSVLDGLVIDLSLVFPEDAV